MKKIFVISSILFFFISITIYIFPKGGSVLKRLLKTNRKSPTKKQEKASQPKQSTTKESEKASTKNGDPKNLNQSSSDQNSNYEENSNNEDNENTDQNNLTASDETDSPEDKKNNLKKRITGDVVKGARGAANIAEGAALLETGNPVGVLKLAKGAAQELQVLPDAVKGVEAGGKFVGKEVKKVGEVVVEDTKKVVSGAEHAVVNTTKKVGSAVAGGAKKAFNAVKKIF